MFVRTSSAFLTFALYWSCGGSPSSVTRSDASTAAPDAKPDSAGTCEADPVNETVFEGEPMYPKIAVDSQGGVHIGYQQDTEAGIVMGYGYRDPRTSEWMRQEIGYTAGTFGLTVDAAGTLHLAYPDGALVHAYLSDGEWIAEDVGTPGSVFPSILVDDEGGIHVTGTVYAGTALFYSYRCPSGDWTWTGIGRAGSYSPIAISNDHTVHIVFGNPDPDKRNIVHAYREPTASSWRFEDIVPTTKSTWSKQPALLLDVHDTLYVPYASTYVRDASIYRIGKEMRWATKGGPSSRWDNETVLPDVERALAARVDEEGRAFVAYTPDLPYDLEHDVVVVRREDGQWRQLFRVGQPSHWLPMASAAVFDDCGCVHVAYVESLEYEGGDDAFAVTRARLGYARRCPSSADSGTDLETGDCVRDLCRQESDRCTKARCQPGEGSCDEDEPCTFCDSAMGDAFHCCRSARLQAMCVEEQRPTGCDGVRSAGAALVDCVRRRCAGTCP